MKQGLLKRIKQLEQTKHIGEDWEPTLTAIVEGTAIPPGGKPIPIWVIDKLLEDFQ